MKNQKMALFMLLAAVMAFVFMGTAKASSAQSGASDNVASCSNHMENAAGLQGPNSDFMELGHCNDDNEHHGDHDGDHGGHGDHNGNDDNHNDNDHHDNGNHHEDGEHGGDDNGHNHD